METAIRLAAAVDHDAVAEIVRSAYEPYVARIGREPGPMLDDYRVLIAEERVSVIERGGIVVGILVLVPQDDAMLLDNVAVAPGVRGAGIGRQLLEHAERVAAERGYRRIRLYTHEAMTENIGLYSRIGYSETNRGEENGFRRVYMSKPLD